MCTVCDQHCLLAPVWRIGGVSWFDCSECHACVISVSASTLLAICSEAMICCGLQQEHKELLNKVEQGQYAGRVHSNGNTCVSDAAAAAAAAADAIDPSGTLQLMQARLEALKVRKQRVTGTT